MTANVEEVAWDIEPLVRNKGAEGVEELLDEADQRATKLAERRGEVASFTGDDLLAYMKELAAVSELITRAEAYAVLSFSIDTAEAARGALLQRVQERYTAIRTKLLFFDLEWAALDDDRAQVLLATEGLDFARHHLRMERRYKDHLLTEPEERILVEKSVPANSSWARLFEEQTSAILVADGEKEVTLEEAMSALTSPDRDRRRTMAESITTALAPGLRTRGYIFNTLLYDKSIDDRLRRYPHWLASRNLANQASDDSVEALIQAVVKRYDIAHRWYGLKAQMLGLDRIADYDRSATLTADEDVVEWADAQRIVLDGYRSFSPDLADLVKRFFDEGWIDAPVRPNKRTGAFCMYTVPDLHPYVFLNWTSRRRDVLTLAHELGHGVHSYLAQPQGIFQMSTPLTLAETASVFGETVVFELLLEMAPDAESRLALLAENVERAIATVFRQVAMNRFEDAVHNERRDAGELSVERFGELWIATQADMLGESVELTDGYRSWWSYIPHFIEVPGYVYAYAYGQLLALSVYKRYEERGADFVPAYLELLGTGGSMPPEELGRIVDCDLADPSFWDGGLGIVDSQLQQAEQAAREAGRVS